jgi:hypothetical protein
VKPGFRRAFLFENRLAARSEIGAFGLFVGVVAAAHEGATLYVAEAHFHGFFLVEGEFRWSNHSLYGEVIL